MKQREKCDIGSMFRYFPFSYGGGGGGRWRRALKVHVYRFRKRSTPREVYHPPAGKQLPTSCLGRFLRPALTFAFLPSLLSCPLLPLSPCVVAAAAADRPTDQPTNRPTDRPRDAIRARREWDQDGGQVHPRLAVLRTRLWHAPSSPLSSPPPPLSLNAVRYFIAARVKVYKGPRIY